MGEELGDRAAPWVLVAPPPPSYAASFSKGCLRTARPKAQTGRLASS